jgi:hypothetical protein
MAELLCRICAFEEGHWLHKNVDREGIFISAGGVPFRRHHFVPLIPAVIQLPGIRLPVEDDVVDPAAPLPLWAVPCSYLSS